MTEKDNWSFQVDWLNVISLLGLAKIEQVPKHKKAKAIKRITKVYGNELLNTLNPEELDEIMANELKSVMRKELHEISKHKEKIQKDIRSKILPLKKGRIIGINMSDLRDIDPNADIEDIIKYFTKKLNKNNDDDDPDDDDLPDEDKTGIYI